MNDKKINEILKIASTPLYIFDTQKLCSRAEFLRQILPCNIDLCYAVKANTFILKEIEDSVQRLEICSPGELRICQRLGIDESKYVISGVYKEKALMEELIADGKKYCFFTVESITQFSLLYELAKKYKKQIKVLLRLTSGNQFGLDEDSIMQIIKEYQNDSLIKFSGIQYFSGTQKTSLKRLKREIDYVDDFIKRLYDLYGYSAEELEFGPGFPVAYFQGEAFDEKHYLQEFSDMLSQMKFKGKILLELGRSLVACCGEYLTKVVDTKSNKNNNYAIVDGGIHQLTYYGQFMAMKHPFVQHLKIGTNKEEKEWNITGSLCTVNDILVKQASFTGLGIGDILVFENTGAYCMTEGISLFLSHELPNVIIDKNGNILNVRNDISTFELNTPYYEKRKNHGKVN